MLPYMAYMDPMGNDSIIFQQSSSGGTEKTLALVQKIY